MRPLLLAALLLLPGAARANDPLAYEKIAVQDCVIASAAEIDDGSARPETIARAIALVCREEFTRLKLAMAKTDAERSALVSDFSADRGFALRYLIKRRSETQQPRRQP